MWQHDLYEAATGNSSNKVLVSNLHHDVTNQELEQIFQLIAPIRRAEVNFDFTGRSKGTAEVVFTNPSDAQRASREYNGQMCKGLPIRIDVVGAHSPPSISGQNSLLELVQISGAVLICVLRSATRHTRCSWCCNSVSCNCSACNKRRVSANSPSGQAALTQ